MTALSELFAAHHATCDLAFADAEVAGVEARWTEATTTLGRFDALMKTHFASEEETLFPAFEKATGMTQGPTQMMRLEHEQMRALLGRLGTAVTTQDPDEFAGAAETLLVLMQQHNLKEERMLYPMCDRAVGGDAGVVAAVTAQLAS